MQSFYNMDRDTILKATLRAWRRKCLRAFFAQWNVKQALPPTPPTARSQSVATPSLGTDVQRSSRKAVVIPNMPRRRNARHPVCPRGAILVRRMTAKLGGKRLGLLQHLSGLPGGVGWPGSCSVAFSRQNRIYIALYVPGVEPSACLLFRDQQSAVLSATFFLTAEYLALCKQPACAPNA